MKLSEAIRLNGMSKPQGRGPDSIKDTDAPCAIGGALQAIGKQITHDAVANYTVFQNQWEWTQGYCPFPEGATNRQIMEAIWLLNDSFGWSRERIAAWIATIEPQESAEITQPILEEVHA